MQLNIPGVIVDGTAPITATPARVDINVFQGVDTVIFVTVTGSNGASFSLAGYGSTLVIKDRLLPTEGAPQKTLTYSGTVSTNTITFTIPGIDLKGLRLQGYWWDVFVTSGTGKKDEPVPTGIMTVNAAVGA